MLFFLNSNVEPLRGILKSVFVPYRNEKLSQDLEGKVPFPRDFLYGFSELKNSYELIFHYSPKTGEKSIKGYLIKRLEIIFARLTKLGFPYEIVMKCRESLNKADIVFALNDPIANALLLGKLLGIFHKKTVVLYQSLTERKRYFRLGFLLDPLFNALLEKADRILVLSEAARQEMIRSYGVKPDRITVFHFGIDLSFWKPSSIPMKERKYIMTLGNDMNRDFVTFEKATLGFETIAITNYKFKAKHIQKKTGLSHEELNKFLQGARLLVIPSIEVLTESSGLSSTLQGMATKTPVIVSDSPPMRELFREREHIFYYQPEDAESLRKLILEIWENFDLLESISRNAHDLVSSRLNVEAMGKQLDKVFQELA